MQCIGYMSNLSLWLKLFTIFISYFESILYSTPRGFDQSELIIQFNSYLVFFGQICIWDWVWAFIHGIYRHSFCIYFETNFLLYLRTYCCVIF
jgi:hypothetical protein